MLYSNNEERFVNKMSCHCYVAGTVQGVFYRQTTKEQALAYNLCGWVKNLPDGRVEVFISGDEPQVKDLLKWLHIGPPRAQVTSVEVNEVTYQPFTSFEIIR